MEANNFYYWGEPVYCSYCGGTRVATVQWQSMNGEWRDCDWEIPSKFFEFLPEEGWCHDCRNFSFIRNLEDLIEFREDEVAAGGRLDPLPNLPEGVIVDESQ